VRATTVALDNSCLLMVAAARRLLLKRQSTPVYEQMPSREFTRAHRARSPVLASHLTTSGCCGWVRTGGSRGWSAA